MVKRVKKKSITVIYAGWQREYRMYPCVRWQRATFHVREFVPHLLVQLSMKFTLQSMERKCDGGRTGCVFPEGRVTGSVSADGPAHVRGTLPSPRSQPSSWIYGLAQFIYTVDEPLPTGFRPELFGNVSPANPPREGIKLRGPENASKRMKRTGSVSSPPV